MAIHVSAYIYGGLQNVGVIMVDQYSGQWLDASGFLIDPTPANWAAAVHVAPAPTLSNQYFVRYSVVLPDLDSSYDATIFTPTWILMGTTLPDFNNDTIGEVGAPVPSVNPVPLWERIDAGAQHEFNILEDSIE